MDKSNRIVIIGAGMFGLSTASQLVSEGFKIMLSSTDACHLYDLIVPDGSSTDISRSLRFDYADEVYLELAFEAYQRWSRESKYEGIFFASPYILVGNTNVRGQSWIDKTTAALTNHRLPWAKLDDATAAKHLYQVLSGELAAPGFFGYHNRQGGWADAGKAVAQLRDDCLQRGVSFICGRASTATSFDTDAQGTIKSVHTLSGTSISCDHFVLAAGAWSSGLVPTYNSTLSTAQTVGCIRLIKSEMLKYKELPIYASFSTGWFNFPPHEDTGMLKMAIHGWGYTRTPTQGDLSTVKENVSSPPLVRPRQRPNYVPKDGVLRLKQGLREILPELADRSFEKVVLCWYTDTPTGDFIMDCHPDYRNLFIGGGGSGHAFKFLPILGEYISLALKRQLPSQLKDKRSFRKEYQNRKDAFLGDGSRGGPVRRELESYEKAKL